MNQFPKMMYRAGGSEQIHGSHFATHIVNDADEEEAALADGWHLTTPDAKAAHEAQSDDEEDKPATRDEMKAKATELGLEFKHNISNVALAEMIEQALAKG